MKDDDWQDEKECFLRCLLRLRCVRCFRRHTNHFSAPDAGDVIFLFVNPAISEDTDEEKWSCHPAVNFKSLLCCVFVTQDLREADNFWGQQFVERLAV